MGSVEADTVIKWQQKLTIWMWMHNALADSAYEPEFYGDKEAAFNLNLSHHDQLTIIYD